MKKEQKLESKPQLRKPSAKKLGLKVRLASPHDDLIRPEPAGYPQVSVGSMLPTGQTKMGSMLPTGSNPHATHGLNPVGSHRVEGQRRVNEVQISIRVDEDLLKRIKSLQVQLGISMKQFFELTATHALEHMGSPLVETFKPYMGSMLPHEDMKIFSTHEDIIMAFHRFADREWTRRDDAVGAPYNDTDRLLLDIAFVSTIEKKLRGNTGREPIRSFNYFIPEIENLLRQQQDGQLPKGLADYHKYVMSRWEREIRPLRDQKWSLKK